MIPSRMGVRDRIGTKTKEVFMSITNFIKFLRENQAQNKRFCRIVEDFVMLYLMIATVWALCYAVGNFFSWMGVG